MRFYYERKNIGKLGCLMIKDWGHIDRILQSILRLLAGHMCNRYPVRLGAGLMSVGTLVLFMFPWLSNLLNIHMEILSHQLFGSGNHNQKSGIFCRQLQRHLLQQNRDKYRPELDQ